MNALTRRESLLITEARPSSRRDFGLLWYWRAIYHRKWAILLIVALVGVFAAMYAVTLPPVFRATTTVMVLEARKKVVSNEELLDATAGTSRDFYATQFEVMKSRDFAERVVRTLNLTSHPAYDPRSPTDRWYAQWLPDESVAPAWLPSFLVRRKPASTVMTAEDVQEAVTAKVMAGLTFQPVRNTQIIKIGFESLDPQMAERVPNTLADIYIASDLQARMDASRQALSFISSQAESLKKKMVESENALQAFREQQKIIVAKGMTLPTAIRKVEDLTGALADARRKRTEAETLLKAAQQGLNSSEGIESMTAVQNQPMLLRLKEAEVDAQRKVKELSQRYGSEHPRMIAAQSDLKAAQENVSRQLNSVLQTLQKDVEVARSNEVSLDQSLNAAKADAQLFNRTEFPLERLQREVESDRQIYNQFMQRYRDIGAGDVQSPAARVVDLAQKPKYASGPDRRHIVLSAMMAALGAALLLALLLERLDDTVKNAEDGEEKLDAKTVGVLQRARLKPDSRLEKQVILDSRGTFAEGIRTIRSGVMLSAVDSKHKTVVLTSSMPGEGKTTVACNLALSFSHVKRTLLIEADMRRPRLASIFEEMREKPGLSDLIAGEGTREQCIHRVPGTELDVLPTGRVPIAPLELLSSHRFTELIEPLQKEYDVVIIDTPPVHLFSDALVLSKFASTVLFVVKSDATPCSIVRNCLVRLDRANAPVLGIVLNQLHTREVHKYHRNYGYYYGGDKKEEPTAAARESA